MEDKRIVLRYLSKELKLSWLTRFIKDELGTLIFFSKEDFYQYMIFQLRHWMSGTGIERFDGVLKASWLFGDKAIKRWADKHESWKYYNVMYCEEFKIKTDWFEFSKVNIEDVEEVERKRFFNTGRGFLNCQELASYNEFSETCQNCNFKQEC